MISSVFTIPINLQSNDYLLLIFKDEIDAQSYSRRSSDVMNILELKVSFKNKDKNVHRYAVRGEKERELERMREMLFSLYSSSLYIKIENCTIKSLQ